MNNSSLIEDKSLQTISESDNSYSSQNLSEPQITNINSKRKKKEFYNAKYKHGRLTELEKKEFIRAILKVGKNNWKKLEEEIPTRTSVQIRSHAQKFLGKLLKKYNILNHKRGALVCRELLNRADIEQNDKFIIEVLNQYRRKSNYLNSLKLSKLSIIEKLENEYLNQEKVEKEISLKAFSNLNINNTSYCNRNFLFKKNIALQMKLYFEKSKKPSNFFLSNVEELLIQNSKFILNLYETWNQYDSSIIQSKINNLVKEFESSS